MTHYPASSILKVTELTKTYSQPGRSIPALKSVTFDMRQGEILALAGESGSGKSTLARCICGLCQADSGSIRVGDIFISNTLPTRKTRLKIAKTASLIFQNPASSLDPRMKTGNIIGEPLQILRVSKEVRRQRVLELVHAVGLSSDILMSRPSQLSGGQLQRVAIARALAARPRLLIADEPLSSLDVSVQAQITNLLISLRNEYGLSILLISHDLQMIRHISDRAGILYHGSLVELSPSTQLFSQPQHPYTRQLVGAGLAFSVTP